MKKLFLMITASAFVLSFSCHKQTQAEKESAYLDTLVNNLHIKKDVQWVIILPGLGCHGCIQEGEEFMKKNVQDQHIYFVLTHIESLKILQNKIGFNLVHAPNVYADKDNLVNIPSDNEIYPCIVELKDGKVEAHEFQSPQNYMALEDLKTRVNAMSGD